MLIAKNIYESLNYNRFIDLADKPLYALDNTGRVLQHSFAKNFAQMHLDDILGEIKFKLQNVRCQNIDLQKNSIAFTYDIIVQEMDLFELTDSIYEKFDYRDNIYPFEMSLRPKNLSEHTEKVVKMFNSGLNKLSKTDQEYIYASFKSSDINHFKRNNIPELVTLSKAYDTNFYTRGIIDCLCNLIFEQDKEPTKENLEKSFNLEPSEFNNLHLAMYQKNSYRSFDNKTTARILLDY